MKWNSKEFWTYLHYILEEYFLNIACTDTGDSAGCISAYRLDIFSYCSGSAHKWSQPETTKEAVTWVNHVMATILHPMYMENANLQI